jgi:hypothetical protein
VREYFKDIKDPTDRVFSDDEIKANPRIGARNYLLLEDKDSLVYQTAAMQFFDKYCEGDNAVNDLYFSVPISTYNISNGYLPQITIYFRQEYNSTASEETKAKSRTMQISMRVRENKIPVTTGALRAIATDIKNIFGVPIYRFRTGYKKVSYRNKALGYEFVISCREELDAENLVKDMMSIFSDRDEYDPRDLKISESRLGSAIATATPRKTRVVSKLVNLPNRSESVRMFFTHADYKVYPSKPILLVRGSTLVY